MADAPAQWEAPARRSRPWPAAALAGALLVVVVFAARQGTPDDAELTVTPAPTPSPAEVRPSPSPDATAAAEPVWRPHAETAGSWTSLPDGPLGPRAEPVAVWTGTGQGFSPRARGEMLVWGGQRDGNGLADGAAYNPMAGRWRTIADAPVRWEQGATRAAAWTGDELVVLVTGRRGPPVGLAYDPEADEWRRTAAPPPDVDHRPVAAWTGREVAMLALERGSRRPADVAYDPGSDTWRRLPAPPVRDRRGTLHAVGLPDGLAVIGEAAGRAAVSLLPADGQVWSAPEPLPAEADAPPLLTAVTADSFGGRLLLMGVQPGDHDTRLAWAWTPDGGWAELPEVPAVPVSRRSALAWGGSRLVAWLGDARLAGLVFDAGQQEWQPMASPPLTPRHHAAVVWTGRALIVWGGTHEGVMRADGAAFLPWTGISDGRLRSGG